MASEKYSKVLLISDNFPFTNEGDSCFIKNEIDALLQSFDKVTIISTASKQTVDVDERITAIRNDIKKIKLIPAIASCFDMFRLATFKEIKFAVKQLKCKFSIGLLAQIFKYYYAYHKLKKDILNNSDEDTVCYSFWLSARAYALARLKTQGKVVKVVSRAHGYDCYLERGYLPFRRELVANLEEIYFISQQGKEYFENRILPMCQDKYSKLRLSHLGVKCVGQVNYEYQKHDTLHIVTCSNLVEVKRLDILIDALATIDDRKIDWTIIGDGALRAELENKAKALLCDKSNIGYNFVGRMDNDAIQNYYANNQVDLIINCSDSEGIPVSIMEAFAFGIPTITRNVGGLAEINVDTIGEFLLPASADAVAFANALRAYASKSDEEKMAKRKDVLDIYNRDFSTQNYRNFCARISSKKELPLIVSAQSSQLQYANVDTNCSLHEYDIISLYKTQKNVFLKILRRIWFKLRLPFASVWYSKSIKTHCKSFDEVVLFDSLLGLEVLDYFKKKGIKKINFWYWNIFSDNLKTLDLIKKKAEIWSFDKNDCAKYGFRYNHQFYGDHYHLTENCPPPSLMFVGRDKGRVDLLIKLHAEMNNRGVACDFYILNNKTNSIVNGITYSTKFLGYGEVMERISKCSCILDLTQDNQVGMTLRVLEGLYNNKKVITNNRDIEKEDIYDKNNVMIFDEDFDRMANFIRSGTSQGHDIGAYTFIDWLQNFKRTE